MSMISWEVSDLPDADPGKPGSPRREGLGEVVDDLIHDITGRRGFNEVWYNIDPDIREEIREEWINIIAKARSVR